MFSSIFRRNFCTQILGMDLNAVTKTLEKFAPTSYAGSWDNVGLLIEPSGPKVVKKVMLTNDLTEPVMQECLNAQVDMIISYHPPIFRPLKRITSKSWKVKKNPNFFKNFFLREFEIRNELLPSAWKTGLHCIRLTPHLTLSRVVSMIGFWNLLVRILRI